MTAAAAAGETMRDVEMGEVQWRPFLGVGMGCRIAVYNGISVVDGPLPHTVCDSHARRSKDSNDEDAAAKRRNSKQFAVPRHSADRSPARTPVGVFQLFMIVFICCK